MASTRPDTSRARATLRRSCASRSVSRSSDALSRETLTLPGARTFKSTDDLLASWGPLVAGKTGHTQRAGWSQAAAARRGDTIVYGSVLGSGSRTTRNDALRSLLTYGLAQYRSVRVIDRSRVYATSSTPYGRPDVELVAPRSVVSSIRVGRSLIERVVAPTALALPIAKGDHLGRVEVYDGNRLMASSNLVAAESVPDAGLWAKAQWYATETVRNLWGMVT